MTRNIFRILLGFLFLAAGALHFIAIGKYISVMPSYLPAHRLLVQISGAAEMLGGLGLLFPQPTRWWAGIGLLALLIAVFPANIYMLTNRAQIPNLHVPLILLWLRLPLQPLMMLWVWWVSRPQPSVG